jgi:hypothetical protein
MPVHFEFDLVSPCTQCRLLISFYGATRKAKCFKTRPTDLNNLEQRISREINAISPAKLLRVIENVNESTTS